MRVLVPGGGRPYLEGDALDHGAPLAWTVPDVLTPAECAAYIARIEELGPTDAPITTSRGFVMDKDIRNNTRVMFDDREAAADLDDFDGGSTAFLHHGVHAAPRTGTALLFQHFLLHEGSTVRSGKKYVLRSDVMYRDT